MKFLKEIRYVFKINFELIIISHNLKENATNENRIFNAFTFLSFLLTNIKSIGNKIQMVQHNIFKSPVEGLMFPSFKNQNN